jgi:hypothetical protein
MMSKFSSRKFTSVLIATALVLGASIALSTSAGAAGKQGTACSKLKLRSGGYSCIANPLSSKPKLTWANSNCAAAQIDYLSNVANLATYSKNATNSTTQSQSLLSSYQNALTVAQTALNAVMNTKSFTVDYDPKTHLPSTQVIGYDAAIAAYQAKLATDQAGIATATAALAKDAVGSQAAKNDQATINAFMTGVKYRQQTIDQLGKTLARIKATITSDQTQITTWTSTVNGAISQQKALTAQLKGAITTAKNARKLVCKKGL